MRISKQSLITALGWNPTGDLGPYTIYTAHDRRPVVFDKAPPLEPPSTKQQYRKAQFRHAIAMWRALPQAERNRWLLAAKRAKLRITGLNLWIHYQYRGNRDTIRTVERHSGVDLLES